jgi:hypothetical protein
MGDVLAGAQLAGAQAHAHSLDRSIEALAHAAFPGAATLGTLGHVGQKLTAAVEHRHDRPEMPARGGGEEAIRPGVVNGAIGAGHVEDRVVERVGTQISEHHAWARHRPAAQQPSSPLLVVVLIVTPLGVHGTPIAVAPTIGAPCGAQCCCCSASPGRVDGRRAVLGALRLLQSARAWSELRTHTTNFMSGAG